MSSTKTKEGERESVRTEPATIRLDASIRQLLGLEVLPEKLALAIPPGPLIDHLEAAHGGGGAGAFVAFPFPIAAVDVQGVLRLARYIDALLLLLPHFLSLLE